MLRLVEIQTHPSSHLVHHAFATSWSENNQIALMTEKGVQILELHFNPHNKTSSIDCLRATIDTSEAAPTSSVLIDTEAMLHKSALQEASTLVKNTDWAPNLVKTLPIPKVIVQTVWSPRGVLHYGRCLLACLTNVGQLTLFTSEQGGDWLPKFDVSLVWLRYSRKKWSKPNRFANIKHQITELQYRANRIKYTAVAWERFSGDEFSCSTLLITASQDGIICLWIVEDENYKSYLNMEPITMAVTNGLKVKLVKVFDSKLTNISSLLWCNIDSLSGVLIVGNIRGLINSVCVKFCDMLKNDEEDVRNEEENLKNDEENVKNSEGLGGEVRNDEGIVKNDGENVKNDGENVKNTEGLGGEVRNDEGNVKNSEGLGGEVRNDEGIVKNDGENVKNDGENVKNDGENVKNSEGLCKEVRDDEVCGENREIVSCVQEVEEVVQKSKAQTEKFSGETTIIVENNVQLVKICEENTQPVIEDASKNLKLTSQKVPNLTPEQDANVSSEQGPNLTSVSNPNLTSVSNTNQTQQPNLTCVSNSKEIQQPNLTCVSNSKETQQPNLTCVSNPKETQQPNPTPVSNPNQTQQPNLTCVSNSKDIQQPIATSVSNPKQTQQPNLTCVSNPKVTQKPNPTPVSNPNQTQQPNLTCVSNSKDTQQPFATSVSNPKQTQQPNLTCVSNPKVTQKPNLTPVSNTNLTSKSNPPAGNVEISVEPLWRDEDLLSISSLICWDVDDVNVCAVCIKDMYIIVLIVQKNSGKLVSTHIHNTNRRNLAGLLKLDNASFLIGSQQGALFKLTLVQDDNGQLKFMNETVQNNFIRSRYGVMGLAASRNRDFVAVNLCVNGPYDHSKLKTLSSLVICSLENREIDLMTMISSNSFVNLDRIWDCLENVRLSILQKSLTYIFPSTIRCQLDTMDIHPLILTMWLTNFVAYSLQLEQMEVGIELLLLPENKSQTMTRLYEEIRLLVFSSHIFQRCTLILSSSSSSFSLLSLRLMRKWICSGLLLNSSMDCHSTTRLTATSIVEQIDVHLRSKVGEGDCGQQAGERETCIVCGNDILSLSDFSVATCTEGHQIRRCTLSLVQIPSDYDEVLQCKRCGVLAHPQAVIGDYASCVFCNSLLSPDQELMPDSQILVLEDEHDNLGQNRRRPRTRSIEMRGERGEESDSDDELVVPKKKSKKKAKLV